METALEHILVNSLKADMIAYLKSHPEDFEEAIELAVIDKQPYSWRAAWLLWSCMEVDDTRIRKHIDTIIDSISTKNDSQKRDLLIILFQMELNDDRQGILFNICVDIWEKIDKKPSVRYTAFKMIVKIALNYPDLLNEVTFLTQDRYMDSLSENVKRSLFKMFKKLKPKS